MIVVNAQTIDGIHTLCVLTSTAFYESNACVLGQHDRRFSIHVPCGTFLASCDVSWSGLAAYDFEDFIRCVHHNGHVEGRLAFIVKRTPLDGSLETSKTIELFVVDDCTSEQTKYVVQCNDTLASSDVLSAFRETLSAWDTYVADGGRRVMVSMHNRMYGGLLRLLWTKRWTEATRRCVKTPPSTV